jgi:PilZ domain-containing protein
VTNADAAAPERRRAERIPVDGRAHAGIMTANSVRVIDISVGGVLLASARSASVGTRGRLSLTLGGSPLAAEVEIRRVVESPDHTGFRIGAMFVGITPAQQDTIERFARQ